MQSYVKIIDMYIYNTNSVCVCVRAFVCAFVRACVKYRRPNGWTSHDQIWHVYADRSGNGFEPKTINLPTAVGILGGQKIKVREMS